MSSTSPRTGDALPVERFVARFIASLGDDSFVRLVLSHPCPPHRPPIPTPPEQAPSPSPLPGPERILARLIVVRSQPLLSLTLRERNRDSTHNLPRSEASDWLRSQLGNRFLSALLETTQGNLQLSLTPGKPPRLIRHASRASTPPNREHDRHKQHVLDPSAHDWLRALGLVDDSGRPLPSTTSKVHQIRRYAEILQHLIQAADWPESAPLRVVDMGCGRGYLTFAAWQLLRRQLNLPVAVMGVDQRGELVAATNAIARRLQLDGLSFVGGAIADTTLEPPDVLIALHACNTATDDAIQRGIRAGSRLIVVAPCCHQQVRPQLEAAEPFAGPLAHGLLAERFAEWLTDALRVSFLEWAGYHVKVIEFVASEHTPKNLLIAGVRQTQRPVFADPSALARIQELKSRFGLTHHALDSLLTPA